MNSSEISKQSILKCKELLNYDINIKEELENRNNSREYFTEVANKWDMMRQNFFSESVREKAYRK